MFKDWTTRKRKKQLGMSEGSNSPHSPPPPPLYKLEKKRLGVENMTITSKLSPAPAPAPPAVQIKMPPSTSREASDPPNWLEVLEAQ